MVALCLKNLYFLIVFIVEIWYYGYERDDSMQKRTIKNTIIILIISMITSSLSYLANSSLIFDKLKKYGLIGANVDIKYLQDICLWVGIILSAILLSANLVLTKYKRDNLLDQRNSLIRMNKSLLASSLGNSFLTNEASFDIRIFIPKHRFLYKSYQLLKIKRFSQKYIIKNIELIANSDSTKGLQFEVAPNPQGLVGDCYTKKMMVFDDNLADNNRTKYGLNETQMARTGQLKWSICSPVFNDMGDVIAIIAIDGKTNIHIDSEKADDLRNQLSAFSHMLYDSVPQLFKR